MIFTYRPAIAADRMFCVSGCSASLRMTRDVPLISMADWADIMHPQIAKVLDRAGVQTIVAEGSVLAGFICFELGAHIVDSRLGVLVTDYVFYAYVAEPFRGNGIARGLFAAAGIDPASRFHYAARTRTSWECRHKISNAIYSPYYARYTPEENAEHERDHVREAERRKRFRTQAQAGRREVLRRPPR